MPVLSMAARAGFSATMTRQPRQARKGATVTVSSGAGAVPARAVSIWRYARRQITGYRPPVRSKSSFSSILPVARSLSPVTRNPSPFLIV
jgi:hypothetical protein